MWQHKTGALGGFTAKYGVDRLVWFEMHDSRDEALLRERRIKDWRRSWKVELIAHENPDWRDLYDDLLRP